MAQCNNRLIPNVEKLCRAIHYVLSNPEKAGMKDWPWITALEIHSFESTKSWKNAGL